MRTLYGLSQSPWTERARWALEHHGLKYRYHEHVPLLGEVLLRRKAGVKKATVPLLSDRGKIIMGSFEIARHAEAIGRGTPLFPRDADAEVAHWSDVAERMTRVGRAHLLANLSSSRDAQRESLPGFMPDAVRSLLAPTTALALRFLMKKYDVARDVDAEIRDVLRPALDDVRRALGSKPYLLGALSYVDLAIATALQAVRPHDRAALEPGTRAAWTNEALAAEYEDLLMWRDAIYRKHR